MKRARNDLYQLLDLEAGEGVSDEEQDDGDDGNDTVRLPESNFMDPP